MVTEDENTAGELCTVVSKKTLTMESMKMHEWAGTVAATSILHGCHSRIEADPPLTTGNDDGLLMQNARTPELHEQDSYLIHFHDGANNW